MKQLATHAYMDVQMDSCIDALLYQFMHLVQ